MEKYDAEEAEACTTPKHRECQIPVGLECPPPPRKKPYDGKKREPPKNGYFQSPDLDALFSLAPRGQTCACLSSC